MKQHDTVWLYVRPMRSGNRFQALDISSLKWYATVCWISIDAGRHVSVEDD